LALNPAGHLERVKVVLFPFLTQIIVFTLPVFEAGRVPVMAIDWVTDAGETVVLPIWIASTWQVPALRRLSEFPVTEQIVGESDWKLTGAPLDAFALNARVLDASVALAGMLNETV